MDDQPFMANFPAPEEFDAGTGEDAATKCDSNGNTGPRGQPTPPPPGSTREDWVVVLADRDF